MASLESAAVETVYRNELKKSSNTDDSSVHGIPETPTIRVTVIQSGRAPKFNIVERTTWIDGAWNEHDGTRHNLTMTGTDVSGILRFKSEGSEPEFFLVAVGVDSATPEHHIDSHKHHSDSATPEHHIDSHKHHSDSATPKHHIDSHKHHSDSADPRWCDLKIDLKPEDVAVLIHPKYYTPGTDEYIKKKEHAGSISGTSSSGTGITVLYYTDDGVKLPGGVFDDGVKLRAVSIIIT
jgi:hypothetical protein